MSKIAIYIRVSTVDQSSGLRSQKKALLEYCENNSFKDTQIYADKLTVANLDRPQFSKLQQGIFAGQIDTIVVWKLDRISRSVKDGIATLCDWLERGVRIIAISQQLDFNGTVGKMVASILFAVAEMERDNIRENVVRGQRAARNANCPKCKKLGDVVSKSRDESKVIFTCPDCSTTWQGRYWGGSRKGRLLGLSQEQAAQIVKLKQEGGKTTHVARAVGCDRSTVCRVLQRIKSGDLVLAEY